MQYRTLGGTGYNVSTISFGAWAIGGTWGTVNDQESLAALHRALDLGVNFIDTADVYGDGHSERLIAQLRKERSEPFFVATKAGRRLPQQSKAGYTRENLESWIGRSLKNLEVDTIDLLQLHCPHPDVYASDEVFSILDDLKKEGMIRHYGISVETVQEALTGIQYPDVQSVQIIFNMFRLKPAEQFFQAARERNVGVLARVPLASGLLTGKMSRQSQFEADDHRSFNRNGEAFDKGETFSGVDYDVALDAVEELKAIKPEGMTLAQFALRWITMFPEVTCAIPGAKNPQQAESNAAAADLPELSAEVMQKVQDIYDQKIRALVHQNW
ncbi:aldo/keto reductase [Deinococcus cellulosilyticus]|uniref:Aldo/keto reductase n=1 Tax=Deinococcus cellulosilyticus (strain DSM 18568 / NBRC 106333 / KACC 11606 / 5516J-15) TaxID=1223518 RepID=A0A511N953_DEIC1|nr:aldo/keto reductase [Deinococcus cellulosilyticus]GEM49016.1 aldo/keto reductase [Deinococcus cellulosilyticus NBRC 106333 = KACC 11606]